MAAPKIVAEYTSHHWTLSAWDRILSAFWTSSETKRDKQPLARHLYEVASIGIGNAVPKGKTAPLPATQCLVVEMGSG